MANGSYFPQIPSTVWYTVWNILKRTPSRKLDDKTLAIELDVQKTAARQYHIELTRLGILNEDGTPTPLAGKWRHDGDDKEIINEILERAYPDELRHISPPDDLDRDKVVRWFMQQNLGEGSAKNKAATYMRLASGISAITPAAPSRKKDSSAVSSPAKPARRAQGVSIPVPAVQEPEDEQVPPVQARAASTRRPDLNVNIQIHISADASSEQIDAIFSAMKRYFDDDQAD